MILITYINLNEREDFIYGIPTVANLLFGAIGTLFMLSLIVDFLWLIS